MAIPESQLGDWSHQGSIAQSKATYATVKRSLEAPDTYYYASGQSFEIFLQGSYGNDTNIFAESDVDVVILLDSVYCYDVSALSVHGLSVFNAAFVSATYPYAEYKAHVVSALQKSFGAADVKPDKKAIKIKANGGRRSADVIVATEFRRYFQGFSGPDYHAGICFFNSNGESIADYPKQHSANCTTKHQWTKAWFKPMVRILKNMRGRLVEYRLLQQGIAPSYFIEGLLYNVPDAMFGKSYGDTFVAAINWIRHADRSKFVCANKLHSLLGDSATTSWPSANCDLFLNALVKLWNNWA